MYLCPESTWWVLTTYSLLFNILLFTYSCSQTPICCKTSFSLVSLSGWFLSLGGIRFRGHRLSGRRNLVLEVWGLSFKETVWSRTFWPASTRIGYWSRSGYLGMVVKGRAACFYSLPSIMAVYLNSSICSIAVSDTKFSLILGSLKW